ncbi:MAG: hypothetical protein EOP07_25635, partial [Proteobacteria bacterium]
MTDRSLYLISALFLFSSVTSCKSRPVRESYHSDKSKDSAASKSAVGPDFESVDNDPDPDTTVGSSSSGEPADPEQFKDPAPAQTGAVQTGNDQPPAVDSQKPEMAVETSPHYDEVSWLASHNSFVNPEDLYGYPLDNQIKSIVKQLDDGVRVINLDIWPGELSGGLLGSIIKGKGNPIAILSHNKPGEVASFGRNADLPAKLRDIGNWLQSHPNEIVTVFFEDYVTTQQLSDAINQAPVFKTFIYDLYANDVMNKGWPRLSEMIKLNKRLVVISDHSDKKNLGVGFAQDFLNENYWSMGPLGKDVSCKSRWDNRGLDDRGNNKFVRLFLMNHFRDAPSNIFSQDDNKIEVIRNRYEKECLPKAKRRVNYLFVDNYDEADWGARKLVEEWNTISVALYPDSDFG